MTYKIQIDDLVRDATPEEVETIKAHEAEVLAKAEAELQKAASKAALLDRLGITEEEAKLLLG
jgi:hypothetical protein